MLFLFLRARECSGILASELYKRAVIAAPYLPHEDLSSVDKHRRAGDVKSLLQPLQIELLHLLVAALHLHRVESEHGQPLKVLRGQMEKGDDE